MQTPVLVLNTNTKRETGRKAQRNNIAAAKAVADIIRTTLGPRSMLKMILDPMGGITMTNDGNCILREIDVSHPAAKSMIELSRTQDEEVGDGTTSVIILAGEMLTAAKPFIDRGMHPRVIVGAYIKALDSALETLEAIARPLDTENQGEMLSLVRSAVGTKFVSRFGDLIESMALKAVSTVMVVTESGRKEIDIKRYARVEKIPGGYLKDSVVLNGVCFNKDVVHSKMARAKKNPRVLLLDCPLEYKKGESQTNLQIKKATDWEAILKEEEDYIERLCGHIISHKPDIVCTEKGVSDLAAHFLVKAGISCFRRMRKTDNARVARATGATVCHIPEEIRDSDIGTGCGDFEVKKVGDEYFAFLTECRDPKACTLLLRGGSKEVLNEMERNLHDAMGVVRNILLDPRVLPGGGATEMAIGREIMVASKKVTGAQQFPFRAVADAMEVIPRTLIENCGGSIIRLLTALRASHAKGETTMGIDGDKGVLVDMKELNIWEPYAVKAQTIKTSIEAASMILRIDDIVSGLKAPKA